MKKFFSSDRKKSPNPQADNPYAQEPANDPYAYSNPSPQPPQQQSRPVGLPSGPRAGRGGGVGLPSGPGPRMNSTASTGSTGAPPPPYQADPQPQQQQQQPQSSGYGSDRYGASGGYGSNRYGDNSYPNEKGPAPGGRTRGPGGYGGLGATDDQDDGRDALLGGGRDRFARNQNTQPAQSNAGGYGAPPPSGRMGDSDTGRDALFGGGRERVVNNQNQGGQEGAGGYGSAPPAGNKYGGYGEERELTEEEQIRMQERELARQIDDERNATVDTGYRILGVINSTIETANGTMQNLMQQDERLRNTERNLDLASIHNRTAEERTKELKHYNRSLWNPGNPFMSKSRAAEREAKMLADHQADRSTREATLKDAYDSQRKYERGMRDIESGNAGRHGGGLSATQMAANNNKFIFDDGDEDDDNPEEQAVRADRRAKEAEINNAILPQMEAGARTLNSMARAFQPRIEESNELIGRIGTKSDAVDDGVRINRAKLDAIYKRG